MINKRHAQPRMQVAHAIACHASTRLLVPVPVLPQILISAMVGHSNPRTALSLDGEEWPSDREGALLETYGLATLVYSTAAFSLVYGFICGLDSVASCSYGMTVETNNGSGEAEGTNDSQVQYASMDTGESRAGSRPRSPVRISAVKSAQVAVPSDPKHGQGGVAALRNQPRAVSWASPPLRGVAGVTMSPSQQPLKGRGRSGSKGRSSHHLTAQATGASLQRSPSAPPSCDETDTVMLRNGDSFHGHSGPRDIPSGLARPTVRTPGSLPSHFGSFPPTPDALVTLGGWGAIHDEEMEQLHDGRSNGHGHREQALLSNHPSAETSPALASANGKAAPVSVNGVHVSSLTVPSAVVVTMDSACSTPMAQLELGQSADTTYPRYSPSEANGNAAADRPSASSPPPSSLIGTWIARCLMLELLVVSVLIVLLHWCTEPLLRALGEPAESIPVATAYVTAASFGLPFVALYHSLNKGLQSSGIVLPVLLISVLTKALCLLAVYVALYHLAANLVALAWILSASMVFQSVSVYAYMRYTGIADAWWGRGGSPSLNGEEGSIIGSVFSMAGLYEYCVLAFPACVAICLEFWLFDLLGALAGLLPDPSTELAVHYLLFTTTLASYMIFSGLSVSVSVLVGQRLGCAGQSANARKSAIVGTCACLCVSACLMLLITVCHEWIARALTSSPVLLARFAECVPVLVAYQAVDGLNTCSTQLLRTLGVQKYGVLLHFSTYYVLGMSASCVLGFVCGLGVMGLWIGLCFGVGLNATVATVWLWRYADWEDQSAAAQTRAVALCQPMPGDSPAAFLSTSDAFVSAAELGEPQEDERTSLYSMRHDAQEAHHEHHGN